MEDKYMKTAVEEAKKAYKCKEVPIGAVIVKNDKVIAKAHNIADDKIILDPGIGFAKTVKENLWLTGNLDVLKELNYPVLLGTSRKSMIGLTLDLPVNERLEGTLVTTVFAVQQGCLFVRVHDILENIRAIKMTKALMQGE